MSEPEYVTRFVPTYIGRDGLRTLLRAQQGRETFSTVEEAQDWLQALLSNTTPDTIRSIWGNDSIDSFEVRECLCWPGHFDPIGIYFD